MSELNFDQVERVTLSPMNRSVEFYIRRSDSSALNLDAEYQRGSVWTVEQKQSLVRSIQMGIPTGSIVINRRPDVMENYVVIDGKQRIEALRDFVDSKFPIPVTWVEKEEFITAAEDVLGWPVPGVRYENLTVVAHRFFSQRQMPSIEAQVATVEEEAEIFRLINSAGTAQTAEMLAAVSRVEKR